MVGGSVLTHCGQGNANTECHLPNAVQFRQGQGDSFGPVVAAVSA